MQEKTAKKSNAQRSEETRAALITAARRLFVKKGYTETGTPEIVKAANVTRGALYHHFEDKADLFRAVVSIEARAVADEINIQADAGTLGVEALLAGTKAYFHAMAKTGRTRLLLTDGPAVLGREDMDRLQDSGSRESLRKGLEHALDDKLPENVSVHTLADLLAAAFDRGAHANARDQKLYADAMTLILRALADFKG